LQFKTVMTPKMKLEKLRELEKLISSMIGSLRDTST
jgi:hypothetical protein